MANQDASQYVLRWNQISKEFEFQAANTWESTGVGSGGSGVSSLNTLTGAVTLSAGSGISLTPTGNDIAIAATGGGSGNLLQTMFHDVSGADSIDPSTGALNSPAVTVGNKVSFTPVNAASTCLIWITTNVEIDSGSNYCNLQMVYDGVAENNTIRGLLYAGGTLTVARISIVASIAFGDTSPHDIQLGAFFGGVMTGSVGNTQNPGTTYLIQEVLL